MILIFGTYRIIRPDHHDASVEQISVSHRSAEISAAKHVVNVLCHQTVPVQIDDFVKLKEGPNPANCDDDDD